MKPTKLYFAVISTFLLSSCTTQISTDLFTSDLVAATEGEAVSAPLVVSLEMASDSKCRELAPSLTDTLSNSMNGAEFIGCEKSNYDTFARYRVQANIVHLSEGSPSPTDAFSIGVVQNNNEFSVFYLTNPDAVQAIWSALPEDLTRYQTFEFNGELSAVINNDLRNTVTIITDDVFADGTPIQGTAKHQLQRRDQLELKMSNVTNAAFGVTDNYSLIVTFQTPD